MDSNSARRAAALESATYVLKAEQALALLVNGIKDADRDVRMGALRGAARLGNGGLPVLKLAIDKSIRLPAGGGSYNADQIPTSDIVELLGNFGEGAILYLNDFLQDPDPFAQSQAVDSVITLWSHGASMRGLSEESAQVLMKYLRDLTTNPKTMEFGEEDYKLILPKVIQEIRSQ